MSNDAFDRIFVMLCDWRGRCIWTSAESGTVNVGEFVWQNLAQASQTALQSALGQVVTVRDSHQVEVLDRNGDRCSEWLWPLHSPEVAVCILGMHLPSNLARLSKRERDCLALLAQGIETQLIAQEMDVSVSTVQTLVRRSREKLGLSTVDALKSFAARYCYPNHAPLAAPKSSA